MPNKKENFIPRPPVVTVMGHIDHGKSTLLDYIRKTNIVDREAGGITQHLSAYEVNHENKEGEVTKITFLDTPGHEAFTALRARGARVADLAIIVVSGEDGVKPQTFETFKILETDNTPFIIAITKVDKPGASVDRTKQNLAENNVLLEGYGGTVAWTAISAKTGEGVNDLLDLVILSAELLELKADPDAPASGVVIETNLDTKKGLTATAIVLDGTLKKGTFAVCGGSISPVRILEDFMGKPIQSATFSSPIRIIGWDIVPPVGGTFVCVEDKKEASEIARKQTEEQNTPAVATAVEGEKAVVPIILKADTAGSLDALVYEIGKLENEKVVPKIVLSGLGPIAENDIRRAMSESTPLVVGFHTTTDPQAESLALRLGIPVQTFDVIYKLTEWLAETLTARTPTTDVEEMTGRAKILKFFSKTRDKQILGGRVEEGEIVSGEQVKIIRRDAEIGRGRIRELQTSKEKIGRVEEGKEFGTMIESKVEIAPGDKIECFAVVKK